jgi:hypothetical protein
MASRIAVYTAPNFLPVEFQRLLSDALSGATGPGAGYLPLTGGTMVGPLLLEADPTEPNGAATKHYADNVDNLKVNKFGDEMTGPLLLSADASANLGAVTLQQLNAAVTTLNDTIAALTARVAALEGTR